MQKTSIVTFNQSPIQYGIKMNATNYVEKHAHINGQSMWYYQFTVAGQTDELPIVPDGCLSVFYCCNPCSPHAILYGSILRGTTIRLEPNTLYFCARFTPVQSMNFHILSFREIVNTQVSLIDTSKECVDICSIIANLHTIEERIAYFEQSVLPRILKTEYRSTSQVINHALQCIYRSGGGITIKELSGEVGYSARYLRLLFEEHLGISPKLFSRIIRFQTSLAFLLGSNTNVSEVAIQQNYFDQSHFLKDFREFSLFTPQQVRKMSEARQFQPAQ
ncbi:helix-turn-helix transcriptional regulator [Paenibacillus sp. P26]|nr:helix-turn-helix transcriptional regulator [Paenibacillus sp. P26]UUZ93470.1 helix-turn-helix transcriptional regulator [Paenibacillus sp. P25]